MTADGAYANNLEYGLGGFLLIMITFLFVDIFDTAGTLYSVGRQAGYVDENDELMNSDEAFMSDAAAHCSRCASRNKHHNYIHRVRSWNRGRRKDWTGRRYSGCPDAIRPLLRGRIRVNPTVRNGIGPCRSGCYDDAPGRRY